MSNSSNARAGDGARRLRTASQTLNAGPFELESGEVLTDVRVGYRTWGRLAPDGANAILVEHALTGSAVVDEWWPGILGAGRALDPSRDFIVATNALGSCYGTTGPTSQRGAGKGTWGAAFPRITVRFGGGPWFSGGLSAACALSSGRQAFPIASPRF
jgi:homoserine acetyltransferase